MRLSMQKAKQFAGLALPSWDVGFVGAALDDRGTAAVDLVTTRSARVVPISYRADGITMEVDGSLAAADTLRDQLTTFRGRPIVLEATTLGFVEILLCCRAFRDLGISSFDILYVEPEGYRNPRQQFLLHRRDFELSDAVPGYRAIPGFAILLGDRMAQRGVFFLGYEDARLRRAFEDLQMIQPARAAITIGVPAFKPGWEIDTLANNIAVVREQQIRGGVYFCGAENPAGAIDVLSQVQEGLSPGERMFVAPIGTKPHGIGAALFASRNPGVGVIYDHPRRTHSRSESIANWHLYSVAGFCDR